MPVIEWASSAEQTNDSFNEWVSMESVQSAQEAAQGERKIEHLVWLRFLQKNYCLKMAPGKGVLVITIVITPTNCQLERSVLSNNKADTGYSMQVQCT